LGQADPKSESEIRSRADPEQIQSRSRADPEQILSRSRADPEQIQSRSRADPEQIPAGISDPEQIQSRSRADPSWDLRSRADPERNLRSRADPEQIPAGISDPEWILSKISRNRRNLRFPADQSIFGCQTGKPLQTIDFNEIFKKSLKKPVLERNPGKVTFLKKVVFSCFP
jgi:hypothetical protein